MDQATIALARHDDGARAAIAFGAALFGAGRSFLQAQPVEQGGARRKMVETDAAAASQKMQGASGHVMLDGTSGGANIATLPRNGFDHKE
jgi:hypothetical protein